MISDWMALAIRAVLQAGREILEIYATDFQIEHKSDRSPVTQADRQAHTIIRSELAPSSLPILSEEGRDIAYDERKNWSRFWLVDPLDGTKEFIKRNGEFTVNIALVEQGKPVAGIIYVPVADLLYFAEKDSGAFKLKDARMLFARTGVDANERPEMSLTRMRTAAIRLPIQTTREKRVVIGSRSHHSEAMESFLERLRSEGSEIEYMAAGSSLKFCLLAEGVADQYPRLGPTMEWDTAAGHAIAEAAGASVTQYDTGTALRYNKESLLNPWFVVRR